MSRLATSRTAVTVAVVEVLLIAAAVALSRRGGFNVTAVLVLAFLVVGTVVAYRVPAHRLGWILLGVSGFMLLDAVGAAYSVLDYRDHHGALPLGPVAVLIEPSWAPAIVLLILSVVLYPDGRLPSRRWRWPVVAFLAIAVVWQLGAYAIATDAIVGGHIAVTAGGDLVQVDQPAGAWAWWGFVQLLYFACVAALLVAWIIGEVAGYRHLSNEQRLQQKWLLGGAAIAVGSFVLIIPSIISQGPLAQALGNIAPAGFIALPVAIGIGILRFRLYEIDRLISRTLSYLIITALLVGTFVALVLVSTRLLPFSSTVGVAASTLAAAALFNPIRVRVQRAVDRRFNRTRYDAQKTVDAFASQLRDAVDLDAVQADLLTAVRAAVAPEHATVWVREVPR